MDLCTRQIKRWAIKDTLHTELIADAFLKAYRRYTLAPGLIHHSDRGIQYASEMYGRILNTYGAISSMSGKGNCYDNAAMESFWATLKTEMIQAQVFSSKQDANLAIFDYIEGLYNNKRLHSSIGYCPPAVYEHILKEKEHTITP